MEDYFAWIQWHNFACTNTFLSHLAGPQTLLLRSHFVAMPRTTDPKVQEAVRYALRVGCTAQTAIDFTDANCTARNLQLHISKARAAVAQEAMTDIQVGHDDGKRPGLVSHSQSKKTDEKPSGAVRKVGQHKSLYPRTPKQLNKDGEFDLTQKRKHTEAFKQAGNMYVHVDRMALDSCAYWKTLCVRFAGIKRA